MKPTAIVLRVLAAAAGVALLAHASGARLGLWSAALPAPPGALAWSVARAAGVAAYLALTLGVLFGLLVSTGAADRWLPRARSVAIHRWLGATSLALLAGHVVALLLDPHAHLDAVAAVVPFLARDHTRAVGLGTLAAIATSVVHASFLVRARLGPRVWRAVHYGAFAAFALATAHGLLAGTDAATPWLWCTYAGAAALVLWLTCARALIAVAVAARATPLPH